jgi:hypothetical protein
MNSLLKIKKSVYFLILCILAGLFAFANKQFLVTDQLFYAELDEQYTTEQIQYILASQNVWWKQMFVYILIPLIIIIRVVYTSFCLYIGNLVQEYHWKFNSLYNISLKADAIFLLSAIFNFYYYGFIHDAQTFEDLGINCLSLLKLVGRANIPEWLILAFNSLNLFELAYIILLILFIKVNFNLNYLKSTLFVIFTYGIGNYLYLTAMTFLYLNFA